MAASQWCMGWPQTRPPHVPDGGLTEVRGPRPFLLCVDCWRLYVRDDKETDR